MLPYGDFFKEVQRTRYDVELLANIFGTTYETVAHRLCNLSDPKRPGLPFHFLRADIAGNISQALQRHRPQVRHGGGSLREVGGAPRLPQPVADHAAVLA